MLQPIRRAAPFSTVLLDTQINGTDNLPATYLVKDGLTSTAVDASEDVPAFLAAELSIGTLGSMLRHLWLAGAKRPPTSLQTQIALGREVVVCERLDLHLVWNASGRLFIKPLPGFLLHEAFWKDHLQCPTAPSCQCHPGDVNGHGRVDCDVAVLRKTARGLLYTYACLITYESDFVAANERYLLPRLADGKKIDWPKWKRFARELIAERADATNTHERFLYAELRLARLNLIHRLTRMPPLEPYLRGWRNYGDLFRDNVAWMAAATLFLVLVLTAMQVGLTTEVLKDNMSFQQASYGFTVFAILSPLCAFGLVVLAAVFNLVKDLVRITKAKMLGR